MGYLGPLWGYLGAISGLSWGTGGPLAPPLGLHHRTLSLSKESAHLIEMLKPLSLSFCAMKTLVFQKKMSPNVEITHFTEMLKSLSLGPMCSDSGRMTSHKCKKVDRCHAFFEDFSDYLWKTLGLLGSTLWPSLAILEPCWGNLGAALGPSWDRFGIDFHGFWYRFGKVS